MAKRVKIPGRLESAETGNIVTGADAVMDDAKGKTQVVINSEVDAAIIGLAQSKQDALTFDSAPTEDSPNPVTSAGVYTADKVLSDAIEAILLLIPSAASALNKLVDMQTMNSSIATATASFKGTYNLVSDLHLGVDATHEQIGAALDALSLGADNNDYAFVQVPNSATAPTEISKTERYKYNGTNWLFEYDLNNSGFTQGQWNTINSGVTSLLVGKLSDLPTNAELTNLLAGKQDNLTFDNVPTAGSPNPVKSGGVYARNNEIVALIDALNITKQDVLTFDNAPVDGSPNPVKSGGVYTAISAVQAAIVALDAAKQNVLTFDSTPTLGSANPVTSSGIKTELNRIDGNITTLNDLYEALTQSALVVVQPTDTWPVASPATKTIYRVVDRVNTPPQYYSDYMWNGSTMVLMATYDNAIDDEPTAGSNNLVKSGSISAIDEMLGIKYTVLNPNIVAGHLINKNGTVTENAAYSYTAPILLQPGESIVATGSGYQTQTGFFFLVVEENVSYDLIRSSIDSDVHDYVYKNTSDSVESIAVNFLAANGMRIRKTSYITPSELKPGIEKNSSDIQKNTSEISQIENILEIEDVAFTIASSNQYITNNGIISTLDGWSYTNPITLPAGKEISVTGAGYMYNVAMIAKYIDGTNFDVLKRSLDDQVRTYKYLNDTGSDIQICASFYTSKGIAISISKPKMRFDNTEVVSPENLGTLNTDMLGLVKDWGFIGDSLSSGSSYYNKGGERISGTFYEYSWGQCICQLCGTVGTNFSFGGATAKSWITKYWDNEDAGYKSGGQSETFKDNPKAVYTICLGTNEVNVGYTVGTWADVNLSDFTQNADSFYGNYAGIIQRIKSIAPSARIFLINIPELFQSSTDRQAINDAIAEIQTHFSNTFIIDMENNCPISPEIVNTYVYWGHPHPSGYQWLSFIIGSLINNTIRGNFSAFDSLPWINTDQDDGNL